MKTVIFFSLGVSDGVLLDCVGCEDLHELHLHGHVDGEEHLDGVRLPQDQGVLQGEARPGVPGGGHEVGREGRDD